MKTEDLVARLSQDAEPAPGVASTLARGLIPGLLVSAVIMFGWLGLRSDMASALATPMFWMKLAYALSLAIIAVPLVLVLARPTGHVTRLAYWLLAPVAVLVLMSIYREMNAPPEMRGQLFMGSSANVCTRNIVLLSLPVLAGAIFSLRRLAPTDLAGAGILAGLFAGAAGTAIYALHCTESAAPFVLVWYTLGIVAMGAIGGALGRLTLRW
jgi:hypothetical protein